jgi:cytochrome oxidase assembly protein ShyY1
VYRFLLRPRWIALILAVIVLVTVFVQLAGWQFRRNSERSAANHLIERNLTAPERPAGEVLQVGKDLDPEQQWSPLTASGTYDQEHQLLVRYRHLGGEPGFEVLTPLVTEQGTALLVDRGWVSAPGGTAELPDVPAPPSGQVTVTGRVLPSEHGPAGQVRPETGQVRFINVGTIAKSLPYPVYGSYVQLTASVPPTSPTTSGTDRHLTLLPPPEQDAGPFLSYGIQWWLFSIMAIGGLIFLAYDEAHDGALRERLRRAGRAAGKEDEEDEARRLQEREAAERAH